MSVLSELAMERDSGEAEFKERAFDDAKQQAEADVAPAALALLNGEDKETETENEHEECEAKRKDEWEAKQAKKEAEIQRALDEAAAMSNDDVTKASVSRLGIQSERLTRRNMKMLVTEYIQTKCLDDPDFARLAIHPRKSMINCFKYINSHAFDYIK